MQSQLRRNSNVYQILIVDDNAADRTLYKRYLKNKTTTFEILEAGDGATALKLSSQVLPSCLLLDYLLPDMTGLEFLAALQAQGLRIPTIMLTGNGDEAVAVNALKRGVHDYLMKSQVNADSLYRAISNAVEKDLLQRKLEEQQQEVEAFSRTAAHDLNAPLRKINAFASLVLKKSAGSLDDYAKDRINKIQDTASKMQELLNDLLTYAKVGRSATELEPVDLQQVLMQVEANLHTILDEQQAELKFAQLPLILGDKTGLIQLFQNLISNGLKYHSTQQARVTVSSVENDNAWRIVVADNGIGIAEEFLQRIFAPFERLHTNSEYSGTGIGLATCKKVVEQHGGKIWAESELGRGSEFNILFPKLQLPESVQNSSGSGGVDA